MGEPRREFEKKARVIYHSRSHMAVTSLGKVAILTFIDLILVTALVYAFRSLSPQSRVVGVLLVLLPWVVGYALLALPFEVKIYEDHTVEFRSFLGRAMLPVSDIRSVNRSWLYRDPKFGVRTFRIRHANGVMDVLDLENTVGFVSVLLAINPGIETKGVF